MHFSARQFALGYLFLYPYAIWEWEWDNLKSIEPHCVLWAPIPYFSHSSTFENISSNFFFFRGGCLKRIDRLRQMLFIDQTCTQASANFSTLLHSTTLGATSGVGKVSRLDLSLTIIWNHSPKKWNWIGAAAASMHTFKFLF